MIGGSTTTSKTSGNVGLPSSCTIWLSRLLQRRPFHSVSYIHYTSATDGNLRLFYRTRSTFVCLFYISAFSLHPGYNNPGEPRRGLALFEVVSPSCLAQGLQLFHWWQSIFEISFLGTRGNLPARMDICMFTRKAQSWNGIHQQ